MAWERKVSERTREEKKYNGNSSYGETIQSSAGVSATVSGGLSFCPKCGSMMLESYGVFKCNGCGYSESTETKYDSRYDDYVESQRRQQREQRLKEQETKNQMNEFLRVMRRGKTRSQAAQISGIPLSRVNHWYREGEWGSNRNTSHFYRELKSIEQDQERRKREEINRQERMRRQERERKQRLENQRRERERKERLRKQKDENKIKNQMHKIISQMENGKTRKQAAMYLGIPVSSVNEWYDKGSKRKGQQYLDFYNKVNTIEIRQKKESKSKNRSSKKYYSGSKNKPLTSSSISNGKRKKQMEELISLMKNGSSRNQAADKLGISVITVNNWYNKGMGDSDYVKFYEDVESIEGTKNKYKSTSTPKITKSKSVSKSKTTTKTRSKSSSSSEIKYCQNCGKKIDNANQIYCSKCGTSLKTGNISSKKTTSSVKTSSEGDSFDWKFCCIIVFVIFAVIGFLSII